MDAFPSANRSQQTDLPFVSVIVPTYRRPKPLAVCLAALAALQYPHTRFEVIVVDDGSAAPPHALVASFRDRLPVTLHTQARGGPAQARNTGAARAGGTWLAFTDDDCAPRPRWLGALVERAVAAPHNMLGGRTVNALHANLYSAASQTLVSYLYEYYNMAHGGGFFTSNNMLVPAAQFRSVGGFDTRYERAAAEDREFCERWLRHGWGMTYVPDAVIEHAHALSLRSFWRQHFNYGRGAYHFHRDRARHTNSGVRVEPLRFYTDLLRYPLKEQRRNALPIAALVGVSQVANAAGYFWERARANGQQRTAKIGS